LPPGKSNIGCSSGAECLDATFETKQVVVEETELIDQLISANNNLYWMVFKVKRRAKKNYERYRRSLLTTNIEGMPEPIGEYSYNWPYDYFSIVELVKINEKVHYLSAGVDDGGS